MVRRRRGSLVWPSNATGCREGGPRVPMSEMRSVLLCGRCNGWTALLRKLVSSSSMETGLRLVCEVLLVLVVRSSSRGILRGLE